MNASRRRRYEYLHPVRRHTDKRQPLPIRGPCRTEIFRRIRREAMKSVAADVPHINVGIFVIFPTPYERQVATVRGKGRLRLIARKGRERNRIYAAQAF